MNGYLLALLAIALLLILVLFETPLGISFIIVGVLGGWVALGGQHIITLLGMSLHSTASTYTLGTIPLFILMGFFAGEFGLARDMYQVAYKWVGALPGGLAIATVLGCGGFAALTGSSTAGAATMGLVAWPEMRHYKYSPRLGLGTIAAAGSLGGLIPPSIGFIVYGLITGESIGKLFIAGIIPGIVCIIVYCISILIRVTRSPDLAPKAPATTWAERFSSLKIVIPSAIIAIVVLGGIYTGYLTPSESGAAGALLVFLMALILRRVSWKRILTCFKGTTKVSGLIFFIILGVMFFNSFMAATQVASSAVQWVGTLHFPRYAILAIILFLYIPMGMFIDALGMTVLTVPFVYPLIISLGFNGIWFAVLLERLMEVGLITPPLALNVFTLKGVAPDVDMKDIWYGIFPYVGLELFTVVLFVVFPQISLWLPSIMK